MGTASFERVVGSLEGRRDGPTVVILGGLHGNEPAGLYAAVRVLAHLHERRWALRGEVMVLAGNRAALAVSRRFVDRDLNRGWTDAALEATRALPDDERSSEDHEQIDLADRFEQIAAEASGRVTFLDLHTTSGAAPPFTCISDTLSNRRAALALPVPIILGLEEVVDGSLVGWLADRGHTALSIEGGRNDDPASVDRHVSAIWLALVAAGALKARDVPDHAAHVARLRVAMSGLPRVVEVRHRHAITPADGFVMARGWESFAPVGAGEIVAVDRRGPVCAPEAGRMLMPLYQAEGDDGFFLVREVNPLWLGVSAALRHLGADRLVGLLPGVERDPAAPDCLVTRPSWTPPRVVEVMHLCGYRRERPEGDRLTFSRRGDPRRRR